MCAEKQTTSTVLQGEDSCGLALLDFPGHWIRVLLDSKTGEGKNSWGDSPFVPTVAKCLACRKPSISNFNRHRIVPGAPILRYTRTPSGRSWAWSRPDVVTRLATGPRGGLSRHDPRRRQGALGGPEPPPFLTHWLVSRPESQSLTARS